MPERIENIVILGGGTAGWMSAAFLQKALGNATKRPIRITLVESPDIGILGVGEATIPSLVRTLAALDIPEWRLIKETDATFKNGIKFVNWGGLPGTETAGHFYHQFEQPPVLNGYNVMTHWLALRDAGLKLAPFGEAVNYQTALCDANLSPKQFASRPYEAPVPYAYHFDAVKFGRLLREVAIERGVRRIEDTIVGVERAETGDMRALMTATGNRVEGDLFIDCSGFHARLIEQELGEPFRGYSDKLLCDRAIACQVPYEDEGFDPRSYTTCTAQSAGWTWEIDLWSRRGTGYVYSSQFISDEDAQRELLAHIGPTPAKLSPRKIEMRIGRRDRFWVNNCVAIGLSGGFLEPLESTGIHLIELGLTLLVDHLGEGPARAPLSARYNKVMRDTYDHVADFIMLHYVLNGRRGQLFWDHCREKMVLPESLREKLEIWSYRAPITTDIEAPVRVFDAFSYMAIMAGLHVFPPFGNAQSPFLRLQDSAAALDQLLSHRKAAAENAPAHKDMVQRLRAVAGD
jgi:tryptophan halogenase